MAITSTVAARDPRLEHRFYQSMIIAILGVVISGFARSFFLRPLFPGVHAPHELYFYLHGVLFTGWLALFFAQVTLVSSGNTALHRRLGLVGFVLIPAMTVVGTVGSLIAAKRPGGFVDIPTPPLEFLTVPLFSILVFAILAGTAIARRSDPQTHKRLMILSAAPMLEAGIARWPFEPFLSTPPLAFWTSALVVVPLAAWDIYSRRQLHPATLAGGALIVASGPIRDAVSHTTAWLAFAKLATALVSLLGA
jgi:hypothetical protein